MVQNLIESSIIRKETEIPYPNLQTPEGAEQDLT